jgi:hypothetical protein
MAEELEIAAGQPDPELDKLEKYFTAKQESSDEAYEDVDEEAVEQLEDASEMLRDTAILLEFLGNPDFCKSITKRERAIIDRHVDKLWSFVEELNTTVSELSADEEEE